MGCHWCLAEGGALDKPLFVLTIKLSFTFFVSIQLLWVEEDRYVAFGFKTPFFDLCAGSSGDNLVKEYHVDSTYRTNRASCELFGVIANINGAGFPVAYMYFKHIGDSTTSERNCKIPALTAFFSAIRRGGINPTFMFSDKDISEIQAIKNVWGSSCGRLCIWHLKKAVDRGLAQGRALEMVYDVDEAMSEFNFVLPDFTPVRAPDSLLATKVQRDTIITMMGDHYCRHPIFNCRKFRKSQISDLH
jgi:hypothetical protein